MTASVFYADSLRTVVSMAAENSHRFSMVFPMLCEEHSSIFYPSFTKLAADPATSLWAQKPPDTWTTDDVTAWGNHVADENILTASTRRAFLINLRRFSGSQLMRMTFDDIRRNFPNVQNKVYSAIQRTFRPYEEFRGPESISSMRDSASEQEKQEKEHEQHRLRWTHIHPDNWSTVEVASWLNYIADEHNFSPDERSNTLAAFDSVTGSQLLTMTREQFLTADPAKGGMLHEIFKDVYPAGLHLGGYSDEAGNEVFHLPPIHENSESASSLETSPSARENSAPCDT